MSALRVLLLGLGCGHALGLNAISPSVASLNNFRDLGCIPCRSNSRMIRPGVIFRAATPSHVSEADAHELQKHIRTIIDLRSEEDASQDIGPRRLSTITKHVELLNRKVLKKRVQQLMLKRPRHAMPVLFSAALLKVFPLMDAQQRLSSILYRKLSKFIQHIELVDVYFWILLHHGDSLRQALLLCSHGASQPVLVHCTHGKDRTGVLIAVLLHICGASKEAIAEEYALSDDYGCSMEGRFEMLRAMPTKLQGALDSCEQFDSWCSAPEEAILNLWDRVTRRFGSMDAYLDSIGIDTQERQRIAYSLTVPMSDVNLSHLSPKGA